MLISAEAGKSFDKNLTTHHDKNSQETNKAGRFNFIIYKDYL